MADDTFTCKDCGKSGDYGDISKGMDPRPNTGTRVICRECIDKYKDAMSKAQAFDGFGGDTYDPIIDRERLGKQMIRVLNLMVDGQWRTLEEIKAITNDPEASISARLRDVRKIYNTNAMERKRLSDGLWVYRVNLKMRKAA